MHAPAGWMMVLVGSWIGASSDAAFVESTDTFAAESRSAVVSRLCELVQPGLVDKELTK